jgi:hypothetical protein
MARSNKVTVWNAAQHVIKVGHDHSILKPGHALEVEHDESLAGFIASGKLVLVPAPESFAPDEPVAQDEPVKKKKKEVTESSTEEPVKEVLSTIESAEDSILPEEVE